MSVQFAVGDALGDHQETLVKRAFEWLKQDPQNEVFYIVPNHIKFETEIATLRQLQQEVASSEQDEIVTMRLQVFSFSRLAWYYLQHTGQYPKESLSENGNRMLIGKILNEAAPKLHVFRGEAGKTGFITHLADLFQEMQKGKILPSDLERITVELGGNAREKDFQRKLADIQLLYQNYLAERKERALSAHLLLQNLTQHMKKQDLSRVLFIISGYSAFTAEERELVETIMVAGGELLIDIMSGQGYPHEKPAPYELFYESGSFYYELYQLARKNGVPVKFDMKVTKEKPYHIDLCTLAHYWEDAQKMLPYGKEYKVTGEGVKIWSFGKAYDEILQIAKEIRRLVSEKNYRYRDIQILTRDLPYYQQLIPPIFSDGLIPYYIDGELSMKHHPFVEFFQSLFAIDAYGYRYRDIMRFLRSGLFLPREDQGEPLTLEVWQKERQAFMEDVDITENIVLAYRYEGSRWSSEVDWSYIHYDYDGEIPEKDQNINQERRSNKVRRAVRDALVPFFAKIKKAQTTLEAASILYDFVTKQQADQQLICWRDLAIQEGNLTQASLHEHAWQAFIQLLDDYVDVFRGSEFSYQTLRQIFETGLETATYGRVPASIDQVSITSLDTVHQNDSKITFVIGATNQVLPKRAENRTLLADDERLLLEKKMNEEQYLLTDQKRDMAREPLKAYLAFLAGEDLLYISFPRESDQQKDLAPSPYVLRLQKGLKIKPAIFQRQLLDLDEEGLNKEFGTRQQLVSSLVQVLRQCQDRNRLLPHLWQQIYENLQKDATEAEKNIFSSLAWQNIPESLSQTEVDGLYGDQIYASVSRFERFFECSYKYFLQYGLQLKERDIFQLNAATTGDLFHSALDELFKFLIQNNLLLSQMKEDEVQALTQQILTNVFAFDRFAVLNEGSRMNYIRYQLKATIQRVSWALRRQSARSPLTTIQTEILFGEFAQQVSLPGFDIPLMENKSLHIRGKIDRLDVYQKDQTAYLGVIDYKSSKHDFRLLENYYGLAMQMVTYLDVALTNAAQLVGSKGQEAKALGALYMHIQNPMVKRDSVTLHSDTYLLEPFRARGLLLNDSDLLKALDPGVAAKEKSLILPFQVSAKDVAQVKGGGVGVSEEEMTLLRYNNRRRFKEAGERIFKGELLLNPVETTKQKACQYCQFRSICQFDPMLKENNYHVLPKKTEEEIMNELKETFGSEVSLHDK